VARLSDPDVQNRLAASAWRREGETIVREFTFENFIAALHFVNRVGELAEQANHHPDILIHGYNKVRLECSTHSEHGLTEADFALAARVDGLQ
jgi:4a-hydroxytetrahydrobiopterin dehydratase